MKTNRIFSALLILVVGVVSLTACSDEDELVKGAVALDVNSAIMPETAQVRAEAIIVDGNGGTVTVPVSAGLPDGYNAQFSVSMVNTSDVAASDWCNASVSGSILTIDIAKSSSETGRIATLELSATATGAEIAPLTISVQQGEKIILSGDVVFDPTAIIAPSTTSYLNGVLDVSYVGGTISIPVANTLSEPVDVEYAIDGELPSWCFATIADGKLIIDVEPSVTATVDQATITVVGTGKTEVVNLTSGVLKVNRAPFTSSVSMVYVKGGTYTMGDGYRWYDLWDDNYSKIGRELRESSNYYKYPVTLDGFYIATFEVTQKLYTQIIGSNPVTKFVNDDYPVVGIDWSTACEFCNKLSEKEGLTPAYEKGEIISIPDPWGWSPDTKIQNYTMIDGANGYRLATSAEWEFAAKGGNEGVKSLTVYAGGNEESEVLWYSENSKVNNVNTPHEVATKQPNYLGLYDMSGNAAEWTYDWGTKYANQDDRKQISSATNPVGAEWVSGMTDKVARGGSYRDYASKCYTYTETNTSADSTEGMGIRLVRSAK